MLTADFDTTTAAPGDWFALWQRIKPEARAGYFLMARRIPHEEPGLKSYLYTSYAKEAVAEGVIERFLSDNSSAFEPRWIHREGEQQYALLAVAEHLYFISEAGGNMWIGRSKLDGTEYEPEWAAARGGLWASTGPNALASDGTYLYACATGEEPGIYRQPLTGAEGEVILTFPEGAPISVTTDGTYLYWIDTLGHLGRALLSGEAPEFAWVSLLKLEGSGGEGLLTYEAGYLSTGESATFSPDGKNLYAGTYQYARDGLTGAITPLEPAQYTAGEHAGKAEEIWVSADGKNVYAATFESLVVLTRDPETGALTVLEELLFEPEEVEGKMVTPECWDVFESPDGKNVYAIAEAGTVLAGTQSSVIAQFTRDPATGKLTPLEFLRYKFVTKEGLEEFGGGAISPDGTSVYVRAAEWKAQSVWEFDRDPETGLLTKRGRAVLSEETANQNSLTISGDGKNLYASDFAGEVIWQFGIGEGGVLSPLAPASVPVAFHTKFGMVVSHDGHNLYALPQHESVEQFSRDPATGLLTPLEPREAAIGVGNTFFAWHISESPTPSPQVVFTKRREGEFPDEAAVMRREPWSDPALSLAKGLVTDGTYLYFSGVGADQGQIGRVALTGEGLEEEWLVGARGRGPLALDSKYLYWAHNGLVGQVLLNGSEPVPDWQPAPVGEGFTSYGLATSPIPGFEGGDWELRLERKLGGFSLLGRALVPGEEGTHTLEFDISEGGKLSVGYDGTTVIEVEDTTLLGGYAGLESNADTIAVTLFTMDGVVLDDLERNEDPLS